MGVAARAALVAVLLVGCDCSAPEAPTEPTPVEPTPPDEALPTPEEVCEAWASEHRGWCEPMGAGAWWMELEGEPTDCGEQGIPPEGEEGRLRIGYSAVDGAEAMMEWRDFDDCETHVRYRISAHHDYDGDDHHEALVLREESYVDGGDTYRRLLTFNGRAIVSFDRLPSIAGEVYELRDVDEDGRPDVVTRGPHQSGPHETDCCSHSFRGGPMTLWHALPDGTFSRSDAVATDYLREACPAPDAPFFSPDEWRQIYRGEVDDYWPDPEVPARCLRLHGRTAEQIRSRALAERAATPCVGEDVWCEGADQVVATITAVADVDPGVVIPAED